MLTDGGGGGTTLPLLLHKNTLRGRFKIPFNSRWRANIYQPLKETVQRQIPPEGNLFTLWYVSCCFMRMLQSQRSLRLILVDLMRTKKHKVHTLRV